MSWGLKTHNIYYSIFASPLPSMDFNNQANFRRQSVTNVISKRVELLFLGAAVHLRRHDQFPEPLAVWAGETV